MRIIRELKIGEIKEECVEDYISAHDHIWPELLDDYKKYGMRQVSSFLTGTRLYVYLEFEDRWLDYAQHLESDQRWQMYMKSYTKVGINVKEPVEVYHYPIGG